MTARIVPIKWKRGSNEERELLKRQAAPYKVVDNCPACGKEHVVDLRDQDNLQYAQQGKPAKVYFSCDCEADRPIEWQVMVIPQVTITLADQEPIPDAGRLAMDEAREIDRRSPGAAPWLTPTLRVLSSIAVTLAMMLDHMRDNSKE